LHPRFDGEVLADGKEGRRPGARIKHRVKNHGPKTYDPFGQTLRLETVLNNPREFEACRWRLRPRPRRAADGRAKPPSNKRAARRRYKLRL
jgi:hypothetical protein